MDKNQILKEAKKTIENIKAVQSTLDGYQLRLEKIVENLEYENFKKEKLLKSDVTNILAVLDKEAVKENQYEAIVLEDGSQKEKSKKDKSFNLSSVVIFILAVLLLIFSTFVTVNKYNPDAKFFNHYVYAYQASNMEPEVENNALVFIKSVKNQNLSKGDNIAYKTSKDSIKILKIDLEVENEKDSYIASSINHSFEDSEKILKIEMLGKVTKSFAALGGVLLVLQDNLWLVYVVSFLLILISFLLNNKSKSN